MQLRPATNDHESKLVLHQFVMMETGKKRSSHESENEEEKMVETGEIHATKQQKSMKAINADPTTEDTLHENSAAETTTKTKTNEEKLSLHREEESKNSGSKSSEKTPFQLFSDRFNEVMQRNNYVDSILIRGLPRSDEENDDDEEEGKGNKKQTSEERESSYTQEEIDSLRFVLLTEERAKLLNKIDKAFQGDNYGERIQMYTSRDKWRMISYIEDQLQKIQKQKLLKKRFNHLFALTKVSLDYDYWFGVDPEGENIGLMAKIWKSLLAHSDEKLGIDPEFTRHGVMAMLEDAKDTFEGYASEYYFNYE